MTRTAWRPSPNVAIGLGLVTWFAASAFGQDTNYTDPGIPSAAAPTAQLNFQTDLFTGRFRYTVPIAVPPGRNGHNPQIALSYSSSGANGWVGVGWALEPDRIERATSGGAPVQYDPSGAAFYDDEKGFVARINGKTIKLVKVDDTGNPVIYRPEIDKDFMRFELYLQPGGIFGGPLFHRAWRVVDKSGTEYRFGMSLSTRQLHPTEPNWINSGNVMANINAWYLERVVDSNGNEIKFTYYKDELQSTPSANAVYLDRIDYNGRFSTFTHTVQFNRDDGSRPDVVINCRSGFCQRTRYRLESIESYVTVGPDRHDARKYELAYETSSSTGKSRLVSLTEYGDDYDPQVPGSGTSLPPVTFTYSNTGGGWGDSDGQDLTLDWTGADVLTGAPPAQPALHPNINEIMGVTARDTSGGNPTIKAGFYNVDGDPLPDRVARAYCSGAGISPLCPGAYIVQPQNPPMVSGGEVLGGSFAAPVTPWPESFPQEDHEQPAFNSIQYYVSGSGTIRSMLQDLDGNGTLDKVDQHYGGPYDRLCVDFDWPSLEGDLSFEPPFEVNICDTSFDIVNDVPNNESYGSPVGAWTYNSSWTITRTGLHDLNGDGLIDWVREPCTGWNNCTTPWLVQFNTGDTTAPDTLFGPVHEFKGATGYLEHAGWMSLSSSFPSSLISLMDINGDGLVDRVMSEGHVAWGPPPLDQTKIDAFAVQLNQGYAFGPVEFWGIDVFGFNSVYWAYPTGRDTAGRTIAGLVDVTGDGLPDRVSADPSGSPYTVLKVQANTGSGFAPTQDWSINSQGQSTNYNWSVVSWLNTSTRETMLELIDMDGDGLRDRVMTLNGTHDPDDPVFKVELNKGPFPDLLTKVQSGLDSQVVVDYQPSTRFDNRDPVTGRGMLPMPVWVVTSTTVVDAHDLQAMQRVEYDYRGGYFDQEDRQFRGFHEVTQDFFAPQGGGGIPCTRVVTRYHQGGGIQDPAGGEYDDAIKAKSGKPYAVEIWAVDLDTAVESLVRRTISRIEAEGFDDDGNGPTRWFPYLAKSIEQDFNGLPSTQARARVTTFAYDMATLNLLRVHRHGEMRVDNFDLANHTTYEDGQTGGDETTLFYEYASFFQSPDILNRRDVITICDGVGTTACTPAASVGRTTSIFDPDTGNLLSRTRHGDMEIATDSFAYDSYGNMIRHEDPEGIVTTIDYNHFATGLHVFPERTVADAVPEPDATGTYLQFTTTREYDPASGSVVEATSPAGVVMRYQRDPLHRLVDVDLLPEGDGGPVIHVEERSYSLDGVVADPENGFQSHSNYNLVRRTDGTSGSFYDSYHFLDGLGRTIQTWVELERHNVSQRSWQVIDTKYDGRGRVRYHSEARMITSSGAPTYQALTTVGTTVEFDALGRPLRITPPPGPAESPTAASTVAYNDGSDPWATVTTDPTMHSRAVYHNADRRAVRILDELGETTEYEYEPSGKLRLIRDTNGNETVFHHDKLGRKRVTEDRDSGTWTYEYDAADRLVEQIDAEGNTLEYDYDGMGRLIERRALLPDDSLEERTNYYYDHNHGIAGYDVLPGQVFAVVKKNGAGQVQSAISNDYDTRGRILRSDTYVKLNNTSYSLQYAYNDADKVTRITYPKGLVLDMEYTSSQALRKISSDAGTGPHTVFYEVTNFDQLARPVGFALSDAKMHTDISFHPSSQRIDRINTTVEPDETPLQDITHEWDAGGNLTTLTDALARPPGDPLFTHLGLESMAYDNAGRLTTYRHTRTGVTFNFDYDAIGNMRRNDETGFGVGPQEDYRYESVQAEPGGDRLQPHAVTFANGRTYTYDANGNMRTRQTGPVGNLVTQSLGYDAQNRLAGVTDTQGLNVIYGYGPDDQRIWKFNLNTEAMDVWIGQLFEHSGDRYYNHIIADGRRIATVQQRPKLKRAVVGAQPIGAAVGQLAAGYRNRTFYRHINHLGSPVLITDAQGAILQQRGYSAYGQTYEHAPGAPAFKPDHLFTDQVYDRDTGLYYYVSRYYDPELGRFIQPDSVVPDLVNPQALNRYAYVLNNPLKFTDPSGEFAFLVPLLAAALKFAVQAVIIQTVFTFIQAAVQALSGDDITAFDGFGKRILQAAVRGAIIGAVSFGLDALSGLDALPDIVQEGLQAAEYNAAGEVVSRAGFLNSVLSTAAGSLAYSDNDAANLKYSLLTASIAWAANPAIESIEVNSAGAVLGRVVANGMIEMTNSVIYVEIFKPGEFGHDVEGTLLAGLKRGAVKGAVGAGYSYVKTHAKDGPGFGTTSLTLPGVPPTTTFIDIGGSFAAGITQGLQGDIFELADTPHAPEENGATGHGE